MSPDQESPSSKSTTKKVSAAEALDILAETERKELAQRIGILVRRKIGYVPAPNTINRKMKRRIEAVMRSGEAHKIADAIARKYNVIRAQIYNAGGSHEGTN